MKKQNSHQTEEVNSSTSHRACSTFLMKHAHGAKTIMCTAHHFETSTQSARVQRLNDHLMGFDILPGDEVYGLLGNQPVYYLQEHFGDNGKTTQWNGHILFRVPDPDLARRVAREHGEELGIVLSFFSPIDGKYYILVKTDATELDEKTRRKYCFKHKAQLEKHLSHVQWLDTDYFTRAVAEEHYDIIDREALFGHTAEPSAPEEKRYCQPMTVGQAIHKFFSNLINR